MHHGIGRVVNIVIPYVYRVLIERLELPVVELELVSADRTRETDAERIPDRDELRSGVGEEDRRAVAVLIEDQPLGIVFLMRIADMDHDLLRTARIDVRVRVDHLDVERIASEPVLAHIPARRVDEAGEADLLLRLDVRGGELEVIVIVRIDVVSDEDVADRQLIETEIGEDAVYAELKLTGRDPGLLRVKHHAGITVRIGRLERSDVPGPRGRILDVISALRSRLAVQRIGGTEPAIVDVVPADRTIEGRTGRRIDTAVALQRAERVGAVRGDRIPRTRIDEDEDRDVLDLVAVKVLVRVYDRDRRGTVGVLVDRLIPRDRRFGIPDLRHPNGDVLVGVRILVHGNDRVHVLEPPAGPIHPLILHRLRLHRTGRRSRWSRRSRRSRRGRRRRRGYPTTRFEQAGVKVPFAVEPSADPVDVTIEPPLEILRRERMLAVDREDEILTGTDLERPLAHEEPGVVIGLLKIVTPQIPFDRIPDDVRTGLRVHHLKIRPHLIPYIAVDVLIRIVHDYPDLIPFLNFRDPALTVLVVGEIYLRVRCKYGQGEERHDENRHEAQDS